VIAGPDATPSRLRDEIVALLSDPAQRQRLADAARRHGRPDAAAAVATEIIDATRA
jgi:UDP-N-acetylglucosamine--N-acetylmuramyl-(pentapeptide) pyrophosphoryl-undecaprenol N-acetylglucosamine transferase